MEKDLLGVLPLNRRPTVCHLALVGAPMGALGRKPKKEREKLARTGMHFVG